MKLFFKQVEFFCLYRVSLKSFFFLFVFFFKVQTKGWIGVLVLYKTAYVVCSGYTFTAIFSETKQDKKMSFCTPTKNQLL